MNAPQSAPPALDSPALQAAFVAAMCRPEAYAALHAVATPIRCIETHVSWVFLTGSFAYKVKKPLQLSFLDYSTPAKRAACCHEELRLNRRHAPDLYLEVVAIRGSPANPRLEPIGSDAPAREVFEHALRMVQFDPRLELGHLLQRGDVSEDSCAVFGSRIAAMHAAAPAADPTSRYGLPELVQQFVLANFAELARVNAGIGDARALPVDQLQDLKSRAGGLFLRGRERMAARRERGLVREGHGDLHCGNVVRWQEALVAFDGIEFDPTLRWLDVASDIGFLTMDLSRRGRDDLRRATLQGWLAASGDFDALALVEYFELYRALVRAKVAALRALQNPASATQPLAEARGYLDWASRRSERPPPSLVLMAGLSGSGKTWLAQRLAGRLDAVIVRSDIERKRLAGLQPLQSSGSAADAGLYSLAFNERTYARLSECVANALSGGESIVVDAANLRRAERDRFIALARQCGARPLIVHCTAPLAVLRQRVTARVDAGTDASEATAALLDRQPRYWEEFSAEERAWVLEVDTTDAAAIDRALQSPSPAHHLRASS